MRQLSAAFLLLRAGEGVRTFLQEWAEAMSDPRVLTDMPNTCGLPNLEEFVDHRHDQSVLTIIAARHGIVPAPSPGSRTCSYGWIFDHHSFNRFGPPLAFSARRFGLRLGIWPNPWTRRRYRAQRAKVKAAKLMVAGAAP